MFNRRETLSGALAIGMGIGLTACAKSSSPVHPQPGRGWAVSKSGKIIASDVTGQSVIGATDDFTLNAPFRIASITKLIVAMAIQDWADAGRLDLTTTVDAILTNTPNGLTLKHLLSHVSGLKDPDVYWADIQTNIQSLYTIADFTHPVGTYFRYSNLNYGLAATIVETQLGERFDRLIWNWVTRHGLDAGLNWSGVSPRKRELAAALYRQDEIGEWVATVDLPAEIPLASPTYLGRGIQGLENYKIGTNGTLFSPQGGMRMSLSDLLRIADLLRSRAKFQSPSWIFDGRNGATENNHFLSFGPGSYVYSADQSPIKGVQLAGHLGEAYGAYTGAFCVPGTELSFAFAQLGTAHEGFTMTGTTPNHSVEHQALFDALAPVVRAHI